MSAIQPDLLPIEDDDMDDLAAPPVGIERSGADRRSRKTPPLSRYWLRGRRRGGRREGETRDIYVDRYSRLESLLVIWLVVATVLDLVLTIAHLRAGGGEANPVMDWFLGKGGEPLFVAAKFATAIPSTLFLLLHVRFRGALVGLLALGAVYMGVMAIHVVAILARSPF